MVDKLNPVNLIWGIVFTIAGAAFVADELGWWNIRELDIAIIGPALLVLAGVVIVVASFTQDRRQR